MPWLRSLPALAGQEQAGQLLPASLTLSLGIGYHCLGQSSIPSCPRDSSPLLSHCHLPVSAQLKGIHRRWMTGCYFIIIILSRKLAWREESFIYA